LSLAVLLHIGFGGYFVRGGFEAWLKLESEF